MDIAQFVQFDDYMYVVVVVSVFVVKEVFISENSSAYGC